MITPDPHPAKIHPQDQPEIKTRDGGGMKELQTHFTGIGPYKGFLFRQICVTKSAFLYEVDVSGQRYYHVFRRIENARFGNVSYPGPNAFGISAWCYRSRAAAEAKFNELTKQEEAAA